MPRKQTVTRTLSATAIEQLRALSEALGLSQSAVLEMLIRSEYTNHVRREKRADKAPFDKSQ